MTAAEAKGLVAQMVANWPGQRLGQEAINQRIAQLRGWDFELGAEAVAEIIRDEIYWPPWAKILDALVRARNYRAERRAHERGLPEPEMTEEQMELNRTKVREILASLGRPVPDA